MSATAKPVRVQLRRIKGWRLPPNTVVVSRPSVWGNPWPVGQWGPLGRKAPDAVGAVGLFRDMMADFSLRYEVGYPAELAALRGKNLACWCPLDQPCHADVLLEIANGDTTTEVPKRPGRKTDRICDETQ